LTVAVKSRLQLFAAAVLFSTGGAAIKACSFDAWEVTGLRAAIAGIALAVLLPEARRGWTRRTALVALSYALTVIVFVRANKLTTALNAIFLQSTSPLYIVLLGPWLLRERARPRDGVFMGILAVGLSLFFVGLEPPARTAPDPLQGNVMALVSGLACGLMVMGFRWLGRAGGAYGSPTAAVVIGNVMAVSITAPLALPLTPAGDGDWAVIGYLGLVQIALAYYLMVEGLRHVPALEASLLMFIEPVLAPIWAWLLHGEKPGLFSLAGGAVILVATLWHAWAGVRDAAPTDPEAAAAS
jgi:DME family drug/metabolite transporter